VDAHAEAKRAENSEESYVYAFECKGEESGCGWRGAVMCVAVGAEESECASC
jgi:hypothetical protein